MKNARKQTSINDKGNVTVSVSMPRAMADAVRARLEAEPDQNFSQYTRRLIRGDLAASRKPKAA
jgi:hypothetical protein